MADTIIPLAYITHNGAAKTLTLASPFSTVTVERIKSIRDLTAGSLIYDSNFPLDKPISMTGAVITYTDPTTLANGDKIQIVLDSTTTTNLAPLDAPVAVWTAQNFPKSPDAGYTVPSSAIDVMQCNKLVIDALNAGSTSLTVSVSGLITALSTALIPLGTLTLNTSTTSGGLIIKDLPPFVKITVTNGDTINAGTVTVNYQKYR